MNPTARLFTNPFSFRYLSSDAVQLQAIGGWCLRLCIRCSVSVVSRGVSWKSARLTQSRSCRVSPTQLKFRLIRILARKILCELSPNSRSFASRRHQPLQMREDFLSTQTSPRRVFSYPGVAFLGVSRLLFSNPFHIDNRGRRRNRAALGVDRYTTEAIFDSGIFRSFRSSLLRSLGASLLESGSAT